MKKLYTSLLFISLALIVTAQQSESVFTDYTNAFVNQSRQKSMQAMWNMPFSFNASDTLQGNNGMAAIAYLNNFFWVSKWSNDTIFRFSKEGNIISGFVIASLTGVRSLTSDGTYLYAATNTKTIFRIEPGTQALLPPHITSQSFNNCRFASYDPTLNSNQGGFWIGNFNTEIEAIDMTGAVIKTIPTSIHTFTGMYGAAIDNYSIGGPYLWVFSQSGASTTQISSLRLTDTVPNTYTYDVYPDLNNKYNTTSSLAGGIFFTNQFISGKNTLIGLAQATPDNIVFVYEINTSATSFKQTKVNSELKIIVSGNSVSLTFAKPLNQTGIVELHSINGALINSSKVPAGIKSFSLELEKSQKGLFILSYKSGNNLVNKKIIIK